MALRVVGAGLPRTGTRSMKDALEHLLGGPCYHMTEVFNRPDHVEAWHRAAHGEPMDWDWMFDGYVAAIDWPASAFWPELSQHWPDAVIVHSHRDPEAWFRSADRTVMEMFKRPKDPDNQVFHEMAEALFHRMTPDFLIAEAAIAAATRHAEHVRATAPADRLVEWRTGDGWAPLCAGLDMDVPEQPFPHRNTTREFRERLEHGPTGGV